MSEKPHESDEEDFANKEQIIEAFLELIDHFEDKYGWYDKNIQKHNENIDEAVRKLGEYFPDLTKKQFDMVTEYVLETIEPDLGKLPTIPDKYQSLCAQVIRTHLER